MGHRLLCSVRVPHLTGHDLDEPGGVRVTRRFDLDLVAVLERGLAVEQLLRNSSPSYETKQHRLIARSLRVPRGGFSGAPARRGRDRGDADRHVVPCRTRDRGARLVAIYGCTVAVEVPQAIAWYNDDGIPLLDGEGAAGAGVDAIGAALQPITHYAFIFVSVSFIFVSVSQLVIALLAAAFGALALRVARRSGIGSGNRA